ncbi:hypothetical protein [Caballeronia sp. Lep1P3]|uniref:hypothetical protein n=1 Tax=Caballeronia sp. Lep1P3 TaxID=2878150 RepID=UPI001FD03B4D|nr:hypothetical protein [Caballeronia sp. Lep1P3]
MAAEIRLDDEDGIVHHESRIRLVGFDVKDASAPNIERNIVRAHSMAIFERLSASRDVVKNTKRSVGAPSHAFRADLNYALASATHAATLLLRQSSEKKRGHARTRHPDTVREAWRARWKRAIPTYRGAINRTIAARGN